MLLGLGSVTCSLMIAGESSSTRCSQEGQSGPPACDEGLTCYAGICRNFAANASTAGAPSDGGRPAGGAAGVAGTGGGGGDAPGGGAGGPGGAGGAL